MGDLISRKAAELALLEKGQHSTRYEWGDIWELNFSEIREALSEVPDLDPDPGKEMRLCYVFTGEDQVGEKCIFHRWIERLQVEPLPESIPAGILYSPPVADKQTLALVENQAGHIQAVEPEKVMFADGRALEAWRARDKEPDVKTTRLWCHITKCKNNEGERCTLDCTSIRGFSLANGKFFQMCDGYEEDKTTKRRRT
jgi:hypothetical protein